MTVELTVGERRGDAGQHDPRDERVDREDEHLLGDFRLGHLLRLARWVRLLARRYRDHSVRDAARPVGTSWNVGAAATCGRLVRPRPGAPEFRCGDYCA
jgi:hypothetical protein